MLAFAAFAFVASVTPGPNNVLLTATGGAVGVLRGLPVLLGIVIGFALMVFILALGLGEFIVAHPGVLDGLRYAGAAVLLWLSWQIARAPLAEPSAADGHSLPRGPTGFLGAALFQWVNPKAWIVAASAITSYLSANEATLSQALSFAMVFVAAGAAGCFPWLAFGAGVKRWLTSPGAARTFNVSMGALLAASIVLIIG